MATYRRVIFANDQIYHIYNRGVERRDVFTNKREYLRALETLKYYRFANIPLKLSKFLSSSNQEKSKILETITQNGKLVEILAFCLMPNHFHFLLKQVQNNGIAKFISNFTNSYTKYFNTKNDREGPLFQGLFKAVLVETDEQMIHLSRYIHLNPVTSFIIEPNQLEDYLWSSYIEYINPDIEQICNREEVMNFFPTIKKYKNFVMEQVDYARELDKIRHLALE